MKTADIARILLDSPALVAPRVLQEKLGPDGYREALQKLWITGETETNLMQISRRGDHRLAMREAAAGAPIKIEVAPVTEVAGRRFFGEATPTPINLVAKAPDPSPVAPPAGNPQAPAAMAAGASIGDQVTVAEGGQTYSARVQSKQPDGKLKLTFGGTRPARDVYATNEIKVVGKPAVAA